MINIFFSELCSILPWGISDFHVHPPPSFHNPRIIEKIVANGASKPSMCVTFCIGVGVFAGNIINPVFFHIFKPKSTKEGDKKDNFLDPQGISSIPVRSFFEKVCSLKSTEKTSNENLRLK